jgi:hypothetical protein
MAKRNREQAVKEKTARRLAKKYAAAEARREEDEAAHAHLRPHQGPS